MKYKIFASILLFVSLAASRILAMDGKFDGIMLAQYMNIPASGASAFDITRLYLTYAAKLNNDLKFQYTSDLIRDTATTGGRLDFFAKFAFLEMSDGLLGGRLRMGLVPTPWIGFEDGVWRYRVQGSSFIDRIGALSSADFGLSLDGKIGEQLEYHGVIVNGAGFKSAETDESKRLEVRLTGKPDNNVMVSGFVSKDYWSDSPDKPRDRYIAQLAYRDQNISVAGDYLIAAGSSAAGKNGIGYSIFGSLKSELFSDLPKGYALIVRLDQYDPDTSAGGDAGTRYIAGVAYELAKGTLILFDIDRYRTESGAGNSTSVNAHLQVKF
ncbi:hypothetical protein HZC34_01470 [Candidatus Saganbacteria bacterium]|nr:hypothetical protein [Candidatus Saganbacteria bacterium]